MLEKAWEVIKELSDWYVMDLGVYILIQGSQKCMCLLPKFVLDKLVLMEVAYHTYVHGFVASMSNKKKETWPKLSICIGSQNIESVKHIEADEIVIKSFHFEEMIFQKHDPRKVLGN